MLLLVVIVAVNISYSPYFLGVENIVNLFQLSIEKIIVALVMTLGTALMVIVAALAADASLTRSR